MTKNQKELKIGFRKNYEGVWTHETYIKGTFEKQIDNIPFEANLQYVDYERGRSALNIKWYDKENKRYLYSGMPLLHHFITSGQLVGRGFVMSKFVFKQQGTSVLLTEYKED